MSYATPAPYESRRRADRRRRGGAGRGQRAAHQHPRLLASGPTPLAAAETAARDRRMARASTVVRMGGLETAVEFYQNQPRRRWSSSRASTRRRSCSSSSTGWPRCCDPGTKVVVIGAANDIALYRELMRRGVSEYLVPPLQPLQLIGAITAPLRRPVRAVRRPPDRLLSAPSGGVGSSTVAHNLAYAVAERMSANTVIVDLDLPFGTAGLDFNQDPLHGRRRRAQPARPAGPGAARPDDGPLHRPPEPVRRPGHPRAATTTSRPRPSRRSPSKIRATAPYVVLDLPHLWSAWMRRMLIDGRRRGDRRRRPTSPRCATPRTSSTWSAPRAPTTPPPRLVLNKVGVPGRPEIPVKDFGEALGLRPGPGPAVRRQAVRPGRQQRPDDRWRSAAEVEGGRGLPAPGPDRGQREVLAPPRAEEVARSPACSSAK